MTADTPTNRSTRITVNMPVSMADELDQLAKANAEGSTSEIVRRACARYIQKHSTNQETNGQHPE
jgi:metal-responsive CopG/Arc/MetJ family transcriptional regulator